MIPEITHPPFNAEPPSKETAIAVVVAPEHMEQAIAEVPADRLVGLIWWLDQIIQRANAAKKCAIIEAALAMDRMELIDSRISVGGHTYILREDSRTAWKDLGGLFYGLNRMGLSMSDIAKAVSEVRMTDLRALAEKLPDDVRADALETIEAHRERKATGMTLVDLDSPYRRAR